MSEATFNFQVDDDLKEQCAMAVKTRDCTDGQLLRDFVRQQQEATTYDQWFQREVEIGVDAADGGDVVSNEEVEAEAAAWRDEKRLKIAGTQC